MVTRVGSCRFLRRSSSTVMARCSMLPLTRITPSGRSRMTSLGFSARTSGAEALLLVAFCGTTEVVPFPILPDDNVGDVRHLRFRYTECFMNYIYGINAVTEALKARGRAFQ